MGPESLMFLFLSWSSNDTQPMGGRQAVGGRFSTTVDVRITGRPVGRSAGVLGALLFLLPQRLTLCFHPFSSLMWT